MLFFNDITGTSIYILASLQKPTGVKVVFYNVDLNVSNDELLLCSREQQVKIIKRIKAKSLDSDKKTTFIDMKTVLLHFSCSEVIICFNRLLPFYYSNRLFHSHYVALNPTDLAFCCKL